MWENSKEVKESKIVKNKTYLEYSIKVKSIFGIQVIEVKNKYYHGNLPFELSIMPRLAYIVLKIEESFFGSMEIGEDTILITAMVFHSKTDSNKNALEEDMASDREMVKTEE